MRSEYMTNSPETTALFHIFRTLEGGMEPDNVVWNTQGMEKEETPMFSSPPTTMCHTGRKFMLRSMFRSLFAPRYQSRARTRPQCFPPRLETLESRLAPSGGVPDNIVIDNGMHNHWHQGHLGHGNKITFNGDYNLAIQSQVGNGNTIAITGSGDVAIQSNEGSGNTIIQMS
jgi:hypothetical protein